MGIPEGGRHYSNPAKFDAWPCYKAGKAERTCPRCHKRRYHFAVRKPVGARFTCAECGHGWTGRLFRVEVE